MTLRCSSELSIPCRCTPDSPVVGTPEYGEARTHPDAGDVEALRLITSWVGERIPTIHLRFADGEFWSILRQRGVNGDGMPFDGDTLGRELDRILHEIPGGAKQRQLIGGDWTIPEHEKYIRQSGLIRSVPWCPSGIWVNGITSGHLATFFEMLTRDPREKILVANAQVGRAAAYLGAKFFEIHPQGAWGMRHQVSDRLANADGGAIVMYCAGMASEVFAWDSAQIRSDLTHLDMGHIFDGAFGIRSRSWLVPEGKCVRRDIYFDRYAPVLRGERSSFGSFGDHA